MEHSIATRAHDLTLLLRDHLGVRAGQDFEGKLSQAGRRLPKWAHRDGDVIVEALTLEGHPKLARQIDHKRVNRAIDNLTSHLDGIDPWKRRLHCFIDIVAFFGFIIFAIIAAILAIMVWRGLV